MDELATFRARLKAAAEAGLLIGVKLTLAIALPIAIVVVLLGDYVTVRQKAIWAEATLRQAIAAQQQQQQRVIPPAGVK